MTTERDKWISCRYLHQPTAREKHHGRCNGSQAADTLQKPPFSVSYYGKMPVMSIFILLHRSGG